jgi:glycosyltransferase involved in cell wall biosynthesis
MRILIVSPSREDHYNSATYAAQLQKYLKPLAEEVQGGEVQLWQALSENDPCFGNESNGFTKNELASYVQMAEKANKEFDVCLLQFHPSGFGGCQGQFALAFANQLQIPLLTTLHQVESNPDVGSKEVIHTLASFSHRLLAFSRLALDFLAHYYKVSREQCMLAEHGVSIVEGLSKENLKTQLGTSYNNIIVSCGEMSNLNGYETAINALPTVLNHYPDTLLAFIVTGCINEDTEDYRKSLIRLARKRGVEKHLLIKQHKDDELQLVQILDAADVVVVADVEEKVLDNPVLSVAVGGGAAVLSTPTWFAKELLEDEKGAFFSFQSSSELSQELVHMLRDGKERQQYRDNASLYGAQNSWAVVAKLMFEVLEKIDRGVVNKIDNVIDPIALPNVNLKHLKSLIDKVGVLKSSLYKVPDFKSGYSLDDTANMLLVLTKACQVSPQKENQELICRLLAMVQYFKSDDGKWITSMGFDRKRSTEFSERAIGKSIWALGVIYHQYNDRGIRDYAYQLASQMLSNHKLAEKTSKAFALIGLVNILSKDGSNEEFYNLARVWSTELNQQFPHEVMEKWQWHEKSINEDFALVPLALLHASVLFGNSEYVKVARRSLRFIEQQVFADGFFNPYIVKDAKANKGTCEAGLMILAYAMLYKTTRENRYLKLLNETYNWFLGDNSIRKSLYDYSNGGCYTGISNKSIEPIQSVSASTAYWLAYYELLDVYFKEMTFGMEE